MAKPSVWFYGGDGHCVAERDCVGLTGTTDLGLVELLITSEALAEMLNPNLDGIDSETAIEVFIEFESDIHRIAQLEFIKRLGGEPPILLTAPMSRSATRQRRGSSGRYPGPLPVQSAVA